MRDRLRKISRYGLGADSANAQSRGTRAYANMANWLAIKTLLLLALLTSGCAQSPPQQVASVNQPHATSESIPASESERLLNQPSISSDFTGNWSVEWCDKTNPELDCGGFSVTLVQKGARICGDYGGALVNMRQVDEGEIVGTIVGDIAILAVESMRNNMIALVRAELHGGDLHWEEVDAIKKGGTDIAIIATNDVLAPTPTKREDSPRSCNALVSSSQEG